MGSTGRPRKGGKRYRVFISHAGEDLWVARQLAAAAEAAGATTFLDVRDIAHGDDFKARIKEEMPNCDELLALFTPWSKDRPWARHEIGMADMLGRRVVCVFYHLTAADFREHGGLGPLEGLNVVDINGLDAYLEALTKRAKNR